MDASTFSDGVLRELTVLTVRMLNPPKLCPSRGVNASIF